MKKALFTLAIAAAALSATAQAPTTFNFQGVVAEKSQEIEVVFEVADLDGTVVYTTDPQTVKTNDSGAFTAVIGDPGWFIDWSEAYTVKVTVNGDDLATIPFQSVPYANYAATYAGADVVEQSIIELTEGNREIRTAIAELREDVDGIDLWTDEFYRGEYADAMREIADQLQVLNEGLSVTQDDVRELSLGTKGEIANIYSLLGEPIVEGETSVAEYLEGIMETMETQDQAAYQAIMTAQEDITALQEGLSISQDDIRELSLGTKGEIANIYSLFGEAIVEGETSVAEYLESIIETMDAQDQASYKAIMAAQEEIDALKEAVAITSDDVQGLMENSRNWASVSDVVALQEAMDIVSDDLQGLMEKSRNFASVEDVVALQDAMEYVSSDVQGLMEWKSRLGSVDEAQITELDNQIQAIWLAINEINKHFEN